MKIKNLVALIFFFLFSLFLNDEVKANNINYCSYGDLQLTLPVTVKVEITGIDSMYPFDAKKEYYYSDSLYVYDSQTCEDSLSIPYIETNNGINIIKTLYSTYYVSQNFYYIYNDISYPSSTPLVNGNYKSIDITPPVITSSLDDYIFSMEKQISLDYILSFISVHDNTDHNIALEIMHNSYSENYDIPGNYAISFKACDLSNNCSTYTQKIVVKDMTPPTIEGISKIDSYMSNPLSLFQIGNKLTAIDNYDGDITTSIYILDSHYNLNYPGLYYVYYNVIDSSNNELSSPYRVNINYIDDIKPVIEGPIEYESYLSSPLTLSSILSNIICSDNIDNNVYENLYVVSDLYSKNSQLIGTYKVILSCFDKFGNESIPYALTIKVVDDIKPTIQGSNTYISYLSSPLSIFNIKNKLMAIDNHDGNISNKIEIYSDEYSFNIKNIGVYYLSFIVCDNSNNYSDIFMIEISIYDDIQPTINGTNNYSLLTNEKININSITLSLLANDNVDGDISHKLELDMDMYSNNYNIPGTYYLSYYVCDNSGNLSLPFKVKIVVSENLSFIKSINNSTIYVSDTYLYTQASLLDCLGINSSDFLSINLIENTYTSNYKTPGTYSVLFELEDINYNKEQLKVNIVTYSDVANAATTISENKKKETIFSYIVSFFQNLFNNLSKYRKEIFT